MATLTHNGLDGLINGSIHDPILAVLAIKNVTAQQPNTQKRFRLTLTDGETTNSRVLMGNQLNHYVEDGRLVENSVIKVKKLTVNSTPNGQQVLILMDFDIISAGSYRPASAAAASTTAAPAAMKFNSPAPHQVSAPTIIPESPQAAPSKSNVPLQTTPAKPSRANEPESSQLSLASHRTIPISSLNPYQNRWVIKGRCIQKSNLREYSNARGEGKLFSFSVVDDSGEIRITAFNKEVDAFFDRINVNHVYFISRASVKASNKQFNPTSHEYELTMSGDTQLEEADEQTNTSDLPSAHFNFVRIADLGDCQPNQMVDVVGVVHECSETTSIQLKASQRTTKKRDLGIVDESHCLIKLTLWGGEADKFESFAHDHPVIVVKAAKLSEFGGRSLSSTSSSSLIINPTNIPEATRLLGWYSTSGTRVAFQNFQSQDGGGIGSFAKSKFPWHTLDYLKSGGIGVDDKPEYITCKAVLTFIKKESTMYRSCPNDGCMKKLVDLGNGFYRCEKCSTESSNYRWRLMLQCCISDFTDNQWITCFQDQGETVLKKKAEELGALKDLSSENELEQVYDDAFFEPYIFRLRASMQTFNDESRLRVTALDAKPVDHKEYSRMLISQIQDMEKY